MTLHKISKNIEINFNNMIIPVSEKLKNFKLIGKIENGQFVKITSKGDFGNNNFLDILAYNNENIPVIWRVNTTDYQKEMIGFQFHIEVEDTEYGNELLYNFLNICEINTNIQKINLVDNLVNKILIEKKNKPLENPRDALTIEKEAIMSLFGDSVEV